MVELEIKKQQIDLEANKKWLQAEDHQLAAQHQWERKKKVHDLQMFCLHLQYQGAGATGMGQFGRDPGAFGAIVGGYGSSALHAMVYLWFISQHV